MVARTNGGEDRRGEIGQTVIDDFQSGDDATVSVEVGGLAPQTPVTVMTPAPAGTTCAADTPIDAVADTRSQVDEADEENNALSAFC